VTKSRWDDPAMDERLRAMVADGQPFRAIANALGVSRNSCIGRARRKGFPGIDKPGARKQFRPQRAVASPDPLPPPEPPMPKPEPDEPVAPPVRAVWTGDLEPRHCKWPLNDGPRWLHCGADRHGDGPYCSEHRDKAFNLAPKRREKVA
jgi:hypothetical protein